MHKYTILISLLFAIFVANAQNKNTIDINWQGSENILSSEGELIKVPLPTDGFIDRELALPFVTIRIPLASAANRLNLKIIVSESFLSEFPHLENTGAKPKHEIRYSTENKKHYANIKLIPVYAKDGKIFLVKSFDLEYNIYSVKTEEIQSFVYKKHSVLKDGRWFRLRIEEDGLYKITYDELKEYGLNPDNIDPANIRLYGNGGDMLSHANYAFRYDDLHENAIKVIGEEDGSFDPEDYILFFGDGPDHWALHHEKLKTALKSETLASTDNPEFNPYLESGSYRLYPNLYNDYSYYFLTTDLGPGLRIQDDPQPLKPANTEVRQFLNYQGYNRDNLNLAHTGKLWFDKELFDETSQSFSFNFPHLIKDKRISMRTAAATRAFEPSTFTYKHENNEIGAINFKALKADQRRFIYAFYDDIQTYYTTDNGIFDFVADYDQPEASAIAWTDFVEYNVFERLVFRNNGFLFRDTESVSDTSVSRFVLESAPEKLAIWDVTDRLRPKNITYSLNNQNIEFTAETNTLREFFAFDVENAARKAEFVEEVPNQDLHSIEAQDIVIVTHPLFRPYAEELAEFHRNVDGFDVLVVEPQQIYNEFSSGAQDPMAIRLLMKMMYDRSNDPRKPGYLILYGDGSYDPKNRISPNHNFIPTVQAENSLNVANTYVTDDFYGLLDDNEGDTIYGQSVDIGIGRLIASSQEEAETINDKIFRFAEKSDSTRGIWRNTICLVADDSDKNLHLKQAEYLSDIITEESPFINLNKIYSDSYTIEKTTSGIINPGAKEAIKNQVEEGALVINYTGHGGELGWSGEAILDNTDIFNWRNINKMPLFITATCEFSRFDNPSLKSAGEYVFLEEQGGGYALFTTTRLAYATTNSGFNRAVYRNILTPKRGYEDLRIGDIFRFSKNENGNIDKLLNIVILGDPALKLPIPERDIQVKKIINLYSGQQTSEINGGSKIRLEGKIYHNNVHDAGFNGTVQIQLYDHVKTYQTLGQDNESYVADYQLQKDILFESCAIVTKGSFDAEMVIPNELHDNLSKGKLSFYAFSETSEAKGFDTTFLLGGTDPLAPPDTEGPKISLKLNDTNFTDGANTIPDVLLIAELSDESGINRGTQIGKDIIASLDQNNTPIVLNDYFVQKEGDYTQGSIRFPFTGLSEGPHIIRLKAWDTQNNSSEASITFKVIMKGNNMLITNLEVKPNPFSTETKIRFDHNLPPGLIHINFLVYDIEGRLVSAFERATHTAGKSIEPVVWNGTGLNGNKLPQGFYVCAMRIKNEYGDENTYYQKIIITN